MRPRSTKFIHLLSLLQWYICASFVSKISFESLDRFSPDHDLENEVKVTKTKKALKLAIMVYLCKFEENQATGSKDIPLTKL